jgi:uncharacterized protein (DUF2147 family)
MIGMTALAVAQVAGGTATDIEGVWRNRRGTVQIRTLPCGDAICGDVIAASNEAIADTAKVQSAPLIGTRIFRDFHRLPDGRWQGRVYVPDLRRTFSGTIQVVAGERLEGRGCALAGLICRTKTWYRVR